MKLSRTTLEFCDWLLDGVTISSQAPDLLTEAKKVSDARDEVDAALIEAGGKPLRIQRTEQK